MNFTTWHIGAAGLFLATHVVAQQTIHVPEDYATIQAAIDAADDGDEVLVAPGTYNEAIDLRGKAIHLRSSDGREVTTIDARALDASVITMANDEGPDTVIEGFTVTEGTGTLISEITCGGGVYVAGSSPTIVDCRFINNTANRGGGIYNSGFIGEGPTITGCFFQNNTAIFGASVRNDSGLVTITACTFVDNTATVCGGGVSNESITEIINSTFENNHAGLGGGIYSGAPTTVTGCTFRKNIAGSVGGAMFNGSTASIESSLFCENEPDHLSGPWNDLGDNAFLELCPGEIPGDINGDGEVDIDDLLIVLNNWGACDDCDDCPADITSDCSVNVDDLLILLNNWG